MPVLLLLILIVIQKFIEGIEFCKDKFFMKFLKGFMCPVAEEDFYALFSLGRLHAVDVSELILLRVVLIG
jgi:hypothetical protein